MLDFRELPEDGRAFEQFIREILLVLDLHPRWSGQGPDQGRDIVATEALDGQLSKGERKWLVQCKHFAHSGRSVGRDDVGSVLDDCRQAGADGYLLVCSTQPSSGLVTKLQEIADRPENRLLTKIWDGVDIEKRLAEPRLFSLGHIFLPKSFSSTPWKLYSRGAPNLWAAHYKSYFLHLSSRISGRYPDLQECEFIIGRLEQVKIKGQGEAIRPRAIYYDDKHDTFAVFADYLVPRNQEPSLQPSDFNKVVRDGAGLHSDDSGEWHSTTWDVLLRKVLPFSDHFDLDHYNYYNRDAGNFQVGFSRGETIGELVKYFDHWR